MTTNAVQVSAPARRRRWKKFLLILGLLFVLLLGSLAVLEGVTGLFRAAVAAARGNDRLNERKFAEAADFYSRAIELRPSSPKGYYGRAIARNELQDYEGALADASRAVELEPGDADYRRVLVIIHC